MNRQITIPDDKEAVEKNLENRNSEQPSNEESADKVFYYDEIMIAPYEEVERKLRAAANRTTEELSKKHSEKTYGDKINDMMIEALAKDDSIKPYDEVKSYLSELAKKSAKEISMDFAKTFDYEDE
ncbi:MAG: hypothetical protein LBM87_01725 [Ruminococcus sp.]|jgi:glutamyl-tRNA reductase|nr:hypothetical protein [Ruminococcus sp.]